MKATPSPPSALLVCSAELSAATLPVPLGPTSFFSDCSIQVLASTPV
jgi:hypothetical protein